MKIRPTTYAAEPLHPKGREVEVQKKAPEVEVRVQVSQAARLLSAARTEDPADLEKVQRLREQIEAGTYEIDDMALARALFEKELQWKP
jgi:flagellar biosynthesis anti-sigma factor FlgM